ncbi:MAG: VOC family protein [Alphaproteobacteria bacterium]
MLADMPVIAFAATAMPAAAKAFYGEVLGLRLVEDSPYALVFDAGGTMLRLQKLAAHRPQGHTVLGWRVDDIAAAVDGLAEKGLRTERFDGLGQDSRGIWRPAPGTAVAWFRDPDGNVLSLTAWDATP